MNGTATVTVRLHDNGGLASVGLGSNDWSGIYVSDGATNTRVGTDGDGVGDAAERNVVSGTEYDGHLGNPAWLGSPSCAKAAHASLMAAARAKRSG